MSGLPTTRVWLDDGTGAFPYDVTTYARLRDGFSFSRGREDEQAEVTSGQLSLAFNNAGGEFTPGSTALATPSPITVDQRIRLSESFLTNLTFDAGVSGWTGGNAVVASVATPVRNGAGAMRLTAIAAADMSGSTATGTSGVPVTPGATYRLSGWFRSAVTARNCFVRVRFYTAAGALVSTVVSSDVTDSTTGWTQASTTMVVPATAAFAGISAVVKAPAAGEQHYVDDMWFGMDRFTGYVKSWRVGWPAGVDSHSVVQVTATDAQARAERRILKSIVEEEILARSPIFYYTLNAPEGATSVADVSGNQAPILTETDPGAVTFGTAIGPGPNGQTAASFPAGLGALRATIDPVEFRSTLVVYQASASPGGTIVGTQENDFLATGLQLFDGEWHVAVTTMPSQADGGGTGTRYRDGAVIWTAGGSAWQPPGTDLWVGGLGGTDYVGNLAHVALFEQLLTADDVEEITDAIFTGFAGETGAQRIARIAGYAGIPVGAMGPGLTAMPPC